jgi:hypothetical protein
VIESRGGHFFANLKEQLKRKLIPVFRVMTRPHLHSPAIMNHHPIPNKIFFLPLTLSENLQKMRIEDIKNFPRDLNPVE